MVLWVTVHNMLRFSAVILCSVLVSFSCCEVSTDTIDHEEADLCSEQSFEGCQASESAKVVVCYFTNWAWYRTGLAKYGPENINASLCTHIIYAFATLDNDSLTIAPYDPYVDIDNKFYEQVVELKKSGVKVLCGIGGWNDSGFEKWNRLLNNETAREKFVRSILEFLEKYGFDGVDMDYEYPGCPQGNRTSGYPDSKENFNILMKELKDAFNGEYLLTVATAGGKDIIDDCYDMTPLCDIVDWLNVMTYDYHSYLDNSTGANAPICGSGDKFGVYETIKYYKETLKCPGDKLVLGFPFYAKTYTLENTSKPEFGVAVSGPGVAGEYTKAPGTLAYYEICLALKDHWQIGYNNINGSYLWKGDQFIAYDTVSSLVKKTCLINKHFDLRGAMLWALDFDDFNNICGCGNYPLLATLNQQMGRLPFDEKATQCWGGGLQ